MGRGGFGGGGGGSRGSFGGGFKGGNRGSFGGSFGGSRSNFGGFGGGSSKGSGGFGGFKPNSSRGGMGLGSSGGFSFGSPGHVHYTGGRIYRGGGGSGMGCGTASILFIVIALIVVFVIASSVGDIFGGSSGSGNVIKSTVAREPLPKGAVVETDYFTDTAGLISNKSLMLTGLKNYYNKTGIQPHVYLTTNVNGSASPTHEELEAYSYNLYDQLFKDEAHLLLVFLLDDYGNPIDYHVITGDKARSVMDIEAEGIFDNYIHLYYDTGLSAEEYFSKVFNDTAEDIMKVYTSPWIPVLIVLGILLIIVILFVWWRKHKKQKNIEAEQTEEMLKTPLEKFDDQPEFDDEAERLGRNYDDDPDNDVK